MSVLRTNNSYLVDKKQKILKVLKSSWYTRVGGGIMKVSEYYDTPIYSDRGRYVGEVQDVVLDFDEGEILGLGFGHNEGKVTTVPYDSIMAIGDIILVRTGKARAAAALEEESES